MSRQIRFRTVRVLALLLVLTSVAGCQGVHDGSMVRIEPPRNWGESIEQRRESRDDYMRQSPFTPLLEEDRAGFSGLEYWEPDDGYYFVGGINAYADPEEFTIISTAGEPRPCERVGWIRFPLAGQDLTLQVYRLLDLEPQDGDLGFFLPFMDATTAQETYPAGRYIDLEGRPGGPYILDFNKAYNPMCAYGSPERFACPVTPPENRLPVRIEAGERGYKPTEMAG